jgi:hypothetical protein
MIRDDPIEKLREVYEMWSHFKQSVADWYQTNSWLIELGAVGVVGIIVVCFVGMLLFAWVLSLIDQGGKKQ